MIVCLVSSRAHTFDGSAVNHKDSGASNNTAQLCRTHASRVSEKWISQANMHYPETAALMWQEEGSCCMHVSHSPAGPPGLTLATLNSPLGCCSILKPTPPRGCTQQSSYYWFSYERHFLFSVQVHYSSIKPANHFDSALAFQSAVVSLVRCVQEFVEKVALPEKNK